MMVNVNTASVRSLPAHVYTQILSQNSVDAKFKHYVH